jgi:hypothetical protein
MKAPFSLYKQTDIMNLPEPTASDFIRLHLTRVAIRPLRIPNATYSLEILMKRTASTLLASLLLLTCADLLPSQEAAEPRVVYGRKAMNVSPLMLWCSSPAKLWTDALAVGNGRLGAMIFGDPESDRLQLNDITVWSGGPC